MFSAKNKFFSALAIGIFLNTLAIAQPAEPRPDQNPALSAHQRAVDLVSRMTLEEKVSEMGNASAAIR